MEIQYFETDQGAIAKDSAGNWRKFNTQTGKFGQFAPAPPSNASAKTWSAPQAAEPSIEPQTPPPPRPSSTQRGGGGKNAVIGVLILVLALAAAQHFNMLPTVSWNHSTNQPVPAADLAPASGKKQPSAAEIAASAYEALGPAPEDGNLRRHEVVKGPHKKMCPDGTPAELVDTVRSLDERVGRYRVDQRWRCK